ncbi:MAG: SpoIID/LytB domain-containing protein [Myxococcaceae bacterium]|nr:SpoIID/LytB domain-containing protein [Myxococcaceae bacterium]
MVLLLVLIATTALPAPLKVRVLQREKPYEGWLAADTLTCDGAPIKASRIELKLKDRRLTAGDKLCDVITAEGGIKVTLDDKPHGYPGKLTALPEGSFIRFIDEVQVEDYLPSVVTEEADGFPAAALEAQAVVSRTFALASRGRHEAEGYDLCDLTHCQLYNGSDGISAPADDASKRTRGEVLLWGGIGLKPAFFHAACGGHTSKAADVFGEGAEGVGPGVSDTGKDGPACREAPEFKWSFEIERGDMAKGLGLAPEGHAFEPLRRDAAGRVLELKAFGRRFRGNEFMSAMGRAFGWRTIRSMKVTAEEVENLVRFTGAGHGHGVGFCQLGAKAMANKGLSRKQILQKYFPDCTVRVP